MLQKRDLRQQLDASRKLLVLLLTRDFRRRHKLHARVTRRRLLGGRAGEDMVKTQLLC
jgi:hypothetical protein